MRKLALVLVLFLLAGCQGTKYNFPSDISDECHGAKNSAKDKIESKGTGLKDSYSCTVKKHPGEKRIGPMWCWYSESFKQYIGGICYEGGLIELGCNPTSGGEVMPEVEEHEFGHYWLFPIGVYDHAPLYKSCFHNWVNPNIKVFLAASEGSSLAVVKVKFMVDRAQSGELVGVNGIDKEGRRYHIDFVKE